MKLILRKSTKSFASQIATYVVIDKHKAQLPNSGNPASTCSLSDIAKYDPALYEIYPFANSKDANEFKKLTNELPKASSYGAYQSKVESKLNKFVKNKDGVYIKVQ